MFALVPKNRKLPASEGRAFDSCRIDCLKVFWTDMPGPEFWQITRVSVAWGVAVYKVAEGWIAKMGAMQKNKRLIAINYP